MEFYANDKVIVNPLRIRNNVLNELTNNLILYYTGTSRLSSEIIEKQQISVTSNNQPSIEAMHHGKEMALLMKEAILKGKLDDIGPIMMQAWEHKKRMASGISNPKIDEIFETAINAGASGGKISGAGGGGFIFFYCPGNNRYTVINELEKHGGMISRFQFTKTGLNTWII
jgi:D-glycero-alpha-D-manno-heptose-7-phosphate kinase